MAVVTVVRRGGTRLMRLFVLCLVLLGIVSMHALPSDVAGTAGVGRHGGMAAVVAAVVRHAPSGARHPGGPCAPAHTGGGQLCVSTPAGADGPGTVAVPAQLADLVVMPASGGVAVRRAPPVREVFRPPDLAGLQVLRI